MPSISFKGKIILSLIILLIVFAGVFVYQWYAKEELTEQEKMETSEASKNVDWKTYRNEEFGFEFQYPEKWRVKENVFGSPASMFNLNVVPLEEKYLPDPVLVNIVTIDFADSMTLNLQRVGASVSEVVVDGIKGSKFEYIFESLEETLIDLPFEKYHIIISGKRKYEDIFNQILATFKFLE